MAAPGRRGAHGAKNTRRSGPKRDAGARATAGSTPRTKTPARTATPTPTLPPGPFRLGAVEGATPGKWIDVWKERMPQIPLELVPLGMADQRDAITAGQVDAAIVRGPLDRTGIQLIALYDEQPVVVCAADSHLTAADELTLDDLAGEVVIVPHDAPLTVDVPESVAPRFAPPATVADAIATVAAGVGVVIVPMSLARLHHRKDAAHRPLAGVPLSPVGLAWPAGETAPLVDAFIGIVRGRTANSSR